MPLIPEQRQHNADPHAYDEYTHNAGVEQVVTTVVDASPCEAFDAWVQHVWLNTRKELAPGVGRGCVGHARQAPLGIAERIVSVGLSVDNGDDDDDNNAAFKIPSVCYKVYNVGPFPVAPSSHIGLVRFMPVKNDSRKSKTLVLWNIKTTTATPVGNLICGGALFRLMLRSVIGQRQQ